MKPTPDFLDEFLDLAAAAAALEALLARCWSHWVPPVPRDIVEWAEAERELSTEESALPGQFRIENTPILAGILAACSDPTVRKVAVMKPAQIGYTAGVVCNVLGYNVAHRPSVQVAVFPRSQSAKDFASEKFDPMVRATPSLAKRINLKSRAQGNSATRKRYPGGLIKLVGANSPSDVKSSSGRIVIVEEPDDASQNVKGQGDVIKLVEERAKSYDDHLILIGGTPTAKGASNIEAEVAVGDARVPMVPCHACGESHTPQWEYVTIPDIPAEAEPHEVYGRHDWQRAFYTCPECGTVWTDEEREDNLRRMARQPDRGWIATRPFSGVASFHQLSELCSTFAGSRVPVLARKYLEADAKLQAGDPGEMIAFWNSSLGRSWEYKGELPEEQDLIERAEPYLEWTIPVGGIELLLTVDVQHDRLAVSAYAIGRGEEMWLVYWGEHHGTTVVPHAGAWLELNALLDTQARHACGAAVGVRAVGIDASDGQTSDAVYAYVRAHHRPSRPVVALKGASDAEGKVEIWTAPRPVDPNKSSTKASRHGVTINIVGTAKAKDLILGWSQQAGRIRLAGTGPGRMHWYQGVRPDWYGQMLSEIKVPNRSGRRAWKKRTDRHNEALDTCVYALYLCRYMRLHLRKPVQWDMAEMMLRQGTLLDELPAPVPARAPALTNTPSSAAAQVPAVTSPEPDAPEEAPADADPLDIAALIAAHKAGRKTGKQLDPMQALINARRATRV